MIQAVQTGAQAERVASGAKASHFRSAADPEWQLCQECERCCSCIFIQQSWGFEIFSLVPFLLYLLPSLFSIGCITGGC